MSRNRDPYNPLNWNWADIGKHANANFWGTFANLAGDYARRHPKFLDTPNPLRNAYDHLQAKALDASEQAEQPDDEEK